MNRDSGNTTCIYCCEHVPRRRGFTSDHVMSRLLGRFKPNNMTLPREVCRTCNTELGRIEDIFACGSREALLRIEFGIVKGSAAKTLRKDRVTFQWKFAGRCQGMYLEMMPDQKLQPVLQVGVTIPGSDRFHFVTARSIKRSGLPEGARPPVFLVTDTDENLGYLEGLLRDKGINFRITEGGPLPIPPAEDIEVELSTTIDSFTRRCAAKVAFNYFTYVHGAKLALRAEFDPIRRFIRYGTDPGYRAVLVDDKPILANDARNLRQTNGHIVTIEPGIAGPLRAQVSFFNHIRYQVLLAQRFGGVWRDFSSGHHFDIEHWTISPLLDGRRIQPGTRLVLP